MQKQPKIPQLLKWDEAMELLRSVDNPTTNQLMNMANFEILRRFFQTKELPSEDFDLRFFMEVMLAFCSDHIRLRRILEGEDLSLLSDDTL